MNKITKTKQFLFKKGEKVICVNSQIIQDYLGELQEGEIYTVEKYDPEANAIYLDEIKMYNKRPFNAARFKKTKALNNYPIVTENAFTVKEILITYKKKKIETIHIKDSKSTAAFLKRIWDKKLIGILEQFIVLYLDRSNNVLSYKVISNGGITGTVIDVRVVMAFALNTFSSSIILAHNHPSGGLFYSEADLKITRKIESAAKFFDITVLDHIILSESSYFSFADENIL